MAAVSRSRRVFRRQTPYHRDGIMFARTTGVNRWTTALVALAMLQFGPIWSGCGSSACSPCRPGTHASNPTESCSACVPNADAGDAGAEVAGAAGSDCEGFTACVHSCGETNQEEPVAATCANGAYSCPAPLVPAASCSKDSWPSGALAGCGPWPQGYDCTCKSICDQGFWTCPASSCTDAGTGDSRADTMADSDANPTSCRSPIAADAGVTGLDDLPIAALCADGGRVIRWDGSCQGSIVVLQGQGVDCDEFWLFDAKTKALQATATGCLGGAFCTGGAPGFQFPSGCFNGAFGFPASATLLCTNAGADGAVDMSTD